jgi:preprotein translocase subunit SecF
MEFVSSKLKIDFLGKKWFAFALSLLLITSSVYIWTSTGEEKFGTDYRGGHEVVVKLPLETNPSSEKIRNALKDTKYSSLVVQGFEASSGEYSIRLPEGETTKAVRELIQTELDGEFGEGITKIIKTDFVGPTIGKELRRKGLIAISIGLLCILGYISYRFEFAFALGAVAALFHDVIIAMGLYLYAGHEINVATLAAALTIVGYSVNDTIIVFDRVREEIFKQQSMTLEEIINFSINNTLSRTVITSLLTLFSAVALLVFGGGAINDLAFFLFVGVICGTYSTIFIAAPVALMWESFRANTRKEQRTAAV